MPTIQNKLSADETRFSIPEETVRRLRPTEKPDPIIGQERAVSALELGLGIKAEGYNIFIMGASGTGRRTVLTSLLENYKANKDELQDIAYVFNFDRPLEPRALFFPAGSGTYFKKALQNAVESIRKQAVQITKSEVFTAASKKVISASDADENAMLADFEKSMAEEGFKVIQIKDDESRAMDLVPSIRGRAMSFDELQEKATRGQFPSERLNSLRENYYRCLDRMSELFNVIREKRKLTEKKIRALKGQYVAPIIDNEFAVLTSLCSRNGGNGEALAHLASIRADLLARAHIFTEPFKTARHKKRFFGRYTVNLVCENPDDKSCIIHEEVPTFANLFGSIDAPAGNGDASVNGHLRLRGGAVHRAFGGYLVLRLQDLLLEEGAWPYLKRVLQSGKVEIQTPPTGNQIPSMIKPQAIQAKLKVIIIGGEHSYEFLYQEDPDFQKLFKVCAEFDSIMPLTDTNAASFMAFVDSFARTHGILPIDDSGMAKIVTHAARLSEYRNMLTTRFTHITDLLHEAHFQAKKEGRDIIDHNAVSRALEKRYYLNRLPEEKYAEMIRAREIVLDVSGSMTGKVNGLAVHDRGYHAFGIPITVTAQAAPGNKGVINIERESGLSGEIYDKAHLIIQGLFHRKYARDIPLAISASICFEQSYTEVDGDSASCAEFFALLSTIAQIPLRQDIAITGSLNQLGDVQPVGGIPEKIEGFYHTCSILGLSGTQGVIIPRRNLANLMLSDQIEDAIERGLFHIWAIDTAEEGLAILSGIDPEEFRLKVYETLKKYAEQMQKFRS